MNAAEDVIDQVQKQAAEWLEMHHNPAELVAGILAYKVVELKEYIVYLERRLQNDNSKTRIH